MRLLVFTAVILFGLAVGVVAAAFETPPAPLPFNASVEYPHFDVQIHSRDHMDGTMEPVRAEHGDDCAAPPATHNLSGSTRAVYAFICNNHAMSVLHEGGYGAVAFTPTQQLTSASGVVTWDMSTETQSNRDWADIWVTPWLQNLTLPADIGAVDLQGEPLNAIHLKVADDFNHAWCVNTIINHTETGYVNCSSGSSPNIHTGIAFGTNEAAVRQSFQLTFTPTSLRFERLASATALAMVYYDGPATVPNLNGAVVQFMQHSYNPEKDGSCDAFIAIAGYCGPTWHWNNMACTPCAPFTLIRPNITEIYKIGRDPTGATITFPPAPAGAMLRFTAIGGITVNGALAPKQANTNGAFLASPYFLPLQAGATNVTLGFAADGSYDLGFTMSIQDIAIWAQGGTPPSTPTPPPATPTSTSTPSSPTPTPVGTSTPTPLPTATSVPPTATPIPPTSTPLPHGTIGITSVGPTTDTHDQNVLSGLKVTAPANVTLTSLSVYVTNLDNRQANRQFQLAVYADNNGVPGVLIANTATGTLVNSWNTLPISVPLQAGQNYWFVNNNNGRSTTVNNLVYNNTGIGVYSNTTVNFGTWPSTFPLPVTGNWGYSIYGSY